MRGNGRLAAAAASVLVQLAGLVRASAGEETTRACAPFPPLARRGSAPARVDPRASLGIGYRARGPWLEGEGAPWLGRSPEAGRRGGRAHGDASASLALVGSRREADFADEPLVVARRCPRAKPGTTYVVGMRPRLLVVGQRDVRLRVKLARRGFNYELNAKAGDSFRLLAHAAPGRARDGGEDLPVWDITDDGGELVGTVPEVTPSMLGWHELVVTVGGRDAEAIPFAVRVAERVRLALTFDDGPSVEPFAFLGRNSSGDIRTPTEAVLDTLAREGIAAAFFVLTSRDRFLLKGHPKAETEKGFELLRRMVRDGHVAAPHWGGDYGRQSRRHTSRLGRPAYDSDGDGEVDRVSARGNALESDLMQCIGRIREARAAEGLADEAPEFVRPPFWSFRRGRLDARPTYERLGLSMIFTDAKIYDGGYSWSGFTLDSWLCSDVGRAIDSGHRDVVLTMHDSNPYTARDLPDVLRVVRLFMSRRGLEEGKQWEFVGKRSELERILRAKRRYLRLPKHI